MHATDEESMDGAARAATRWPLWRRVLAYGLLAAAAVGGVALVDRGAMSVDEGGGNPAATAPAAR